MTDFILGFYVDRLDTQADPHIVWAGFTEAERAAHKAWILKNLPQPPVNFHDTQAPIVITEPGRYLQADGRLFRVAQIRGVMAYGYVQKKHPAYSDRLLALVRQAPKLAEFIHFLHTTAVLDPDDDVEWIEFVTELNEQLGL